MEQFLETPTMVPSQSPLKAQAGSVRVHLQAIIRRLQVAALTYQLKDRHICVLNTIASFARDTTTDGRIIVFASNDALCARGYGMNVQRLQRTLRDLIAAGLIHRKLSPNGKRYVHRNREGDILEAFGIDLGPLFARESEIDAAACETEELNCEVSRWRDKLSSLRHLAPQCGMLLSEIRAELRRKPDLLRLKNRFADITARYHQLDAQAVETVLLNANDYQIDMHHQSSIQNIKKEKELFIEIAEEEIQAHDVIDICTEAVAFAETKPQNWQDLHHLASKLTPMIGIPNILFERALRQLGAVGFTTTILSLMQRLETIRQPSAYLASLLQRNAAQYRPRNFLFSLRRTLNSSHAFTR